MLRWIDERLGMASWARTGLRKIFPDHWSFLLGEVALFCLVILVATGVFLTLFYVPDAQLVEYQGSYPPLVGQEVSRAYASVLDLSFDVKAGLVMRQIHHWAALVFVAAITLHILRIFFTGAFRKPREINWLVGIGLLVMALALGITGYSLPDDLLSGTGLRVIYSVVISIPFIGPYLGFLVFGGEFPTETIISRLFVFHVMLLPALLIGGVLTHLAILWRQKHSQFRVPGATERNVVGRAFWPSQVFKSTGLMFLTAAVLALMGGLVQINPIWAYGPFDATTVSAPAQPDWYVGWLDGALRLFPPVEFTLLGVTVPTVFIPGVVIPGLAFGIMTLWPFIEPRLTGDREEHQILDRPYDNPLRASVGVAGLLVFVVLTVAGGNDVIALVFNVRVEIMTELLRIAFFVVPILGFAITFRVCRELQARAGAPDARRPVVIVRNAAGGYEERSDD
ncbi:MAG TPA: cytochrome bc complex cytochrome b subunit [Candidatus Limnocylindrales bacterium]|nr:cytochrome bc complex cytochrome b subunit [Candidatus Limnocylindrales bacterium]